MQTEEVFIKLWTDLYSRFTEDKVRFDSILELWYFTNEPGLFVPWSARNMAFTIEEKQFIKNKLVEENIIMLTNMRWYILVDIKELKEKIHYAVCG